MRVLHPVKGRGPTTTESLLRAETIPQGTAQLYEEDEAHQSRDAADHPPPPKLLEDKKVLARE